MNTETLLSVDKPLYTIKETAKVLRVTEMTVYRQMRAGQLRTVKIGRRTVVRRDDLEALIDSLSHKP